MNPRDYGLEKYKRNILRLLKDNHLEEALEPCLHICNTEPGNAENWTILAAIQTQLGEIEAAIGSYRKAIKLRSDAPELQLMLGNLLFTLGRITESESCYENAVRLKPDYSEAYANLGKAQQSQGHFSNAEVNFRKALEFQPASFDSHNEVGMALSGQGKLQEAIDAYRKALSIKPDFHIACSNLLLTLNYLPGRTADQIYTEHKNLCKTTFQHIRRFDKYKNIADPARRLRIGYVSADFRDHSVACFFDALPKYHNRDEFEVICYSDVIRNDNVTKHLMDISDGWRSIYGQPDKKVAELIHSDKIDLLIDLSGHTARNRLAVFASKPAPVQISYLGYPNTTGLTEINYRLTDMIADPEGLSDTYYTESLIRLPGCFLCYTPLTNTTPTGICPSEKNQYITFGSFNNFSKMTIDVLQAWASLLRMIPDARLILKNFALSDPGTRTHCYTLFEQFGVDKHRLELHSATLSKKEHLNMYDRIDVALDTFPYNGTTTTCESLWMGVPVISLEGNCHAGRVGLSLLSSIGLQNLVANDKQTYCELAASVAKSRPLRQEWRTSLRNIIENSSLRDTKSYVLKVESTYRKIWEDWCSNNKGNSD